MFIYGEHTTTAENTKFRPIEKSNNHKGFQDSGNVFMRFSGLHLWLYGEQHFFMQLCFAERTVIDWTALTRPSDYLTEHSTTNGLRLQTIIHLKFTEFSLERMTVAPLHKAKWDYSTLAQQTSKLARFSLYIIKENIWWCHRTRMRTASIILH